MNTAKKQNLQSKTMRQKILKITAAAIFTALAYASMIPLRFNVQFLTFDVKDVIITLAAMFFGPLIGVIISVVVPLLEMITISGTAYYGFIMNVLASLAFVLPASLVYKYKKSVPAAVIGLAASVFSMTAMMILANLIVTPHFLGAPVEQVVAMIVPLLLPFNIVKSLVNAGIVLLFLQPLANALKRNPSLCSLSNYSDCSSGDKSRAKQKAQTILVYVFAAAVVIASFTVLFVVLGGEIKFFDLLKSK